MKHILLILFTVLCAPVLSYAQNCTAQPEVMVRLKPPRFGTPVLSESLLGADNTEMTVMHALSNDIDDTVMIGMQTNPQSAPTAKSLFIASVDRRGRDRWTKLYDINDLKSVAGVQKVSNGLAIVIVTQHAEKLPVTTLVHLDQDYTLKDKKVIDRHFDAKAFIKTNNGFMVAGNTMNGNTSVARIIGLSATKKVAFQRLYNHGGATSLMNVTPLPNGTYAATGHIADANNRLAGWIMVINDRGEVSWQQQYQRGDAARIIEATPLIGGDIMINGQIVAMKNEKTSAAWVARIDSQNGLMQWERFITTQDYHLAAKNTVIPGGSNVSYTMIRAKPQGQPKGATDSLARVIALNTRGDLVDVKDYSAHKGAKASGMIETVGQNGLIYGTVQNGLSAEDPSQNRRFQNGWAVRMPLSVDYRDPCMPDPGPNVTTPKTNLRVDPLPAAPVFP